MSNICVLWTVATNTISHFATIVKATSFWVLQILQIREYSFNLPWNPTFYGNFLLRMLMICRLTIVKATFHCRTCQWVVAWEWKTFTSSIMIVCRQLRSCQWLVIVEAQTWSKYTSRSGPKKNMGLLVLKGKRRKRRSEFITICHKSVTQVWE